MNIQIKTITPADIAAWDTYVNAHPQSTLYHVSGWKNVIEKTYGHKTYYLMAIKNVRDPVSSIGYPEDCWNPPSCPSKTLSFRKQPHL